MKIINKHIITGFILGTIISSSIIYAGTLFAKDITYDNTNSNINADTVQKAIDVLDTKANSITDDLSNQITSLTNSNISKQNTIDELNDQLNNMITAVNYGEFTPTNLSVQTINVGFRPKKIYIVAPVSANSICLSVFIYNRNNDNKMEANWECGYGANGSGTFEDYDVSRISFSITDNGFTYKPSDNNGIKKTLWYAVK